MTVTTRKRRKNQARRRRTIQRKASSASVLSNNTNSLTPEEKTNALKGYVDELVELKKKSKTHNHSLRHSVYSTYLKKIRKAGLMWVTFNTLKLRVIRAYNHYKDSKDEMIIDMNDTSFDTGSLANNTQETNQTCHGRPIGTSSQNKKKHSYNCAVAKNEITKRYYSKMIESKKALKGKVQEGTYKAIYKEVTSSLDLPSDFKFGYHSCRKRIVRGTLEFGADYSKSPLHNVEYKFVQILLALADTGMPVSMGQGMKLLQSLIEGTPSQQKLISMQLKIANGRRAPVQNPTTIGKISRSYYYGFLHRFKDILEANKGRRFELSRTKWTNYRNFLHMYIDVEKILIEAKLASKVDQPVWKNKQNITVDENDSYGCKVSTDLNLPQCCVVMDEVGSDLNMMNDGHLGGTKFITRKGNNAVINATKKSKRFTCLGLTTLSGQPLMCVVIFEGKERNPVMESGIDMFHPLAKEFDGDIDESNIDFFENNFGPGKLFPGGPVCEFEGISIPTMIRYSEKGSITGDILKDILLTLDHLKVFDKYRDDGATPFLMVDGHQSRFSLPFLEYITNPQHPWKVSIGVPYGTALWQVGDSYQQNGRFKIILNTLKKKLMEYRMDNFTSEMELQPTDIMAMIHTAWNASFADVAGNIEAIAERGWFPLTKKLLLEPRLRLTMTEEDREMESTLDMIGLLQQMNEQDDNVISSYDDRNSLNFQEGFSSDMIDRLVAHNDLAKARARNNLKREMGVSSKSLMKQVKRLTSAGEIVRVANTHEIGISILEELLLRKEDLETAAFKKEQKKLDSHLKNIGELVKLREEKPDDKNWSSNEMKIGIKALKKSEDGKTPTIKKDLRRLWDEIKHREVSVFATFDGSAGTDSNVQQE